MISFLALQISNTWFGSNNGLHNGLALSKWGTFQAAGLSSCSPGNFISAGVDGTFIYLRFSFNWKVVVSVCTVSVFKICPSGAQTPDRRKTNHFRGTHLDPYSRSPTVGLWFRRPPGNHVVWARGPRNCTVEENLQRAKAAWSFLIRAPGGFPSHGGSPKMFGW